MRNSSATKVEEYGAAAPSEIKNEVVMRLLTPEEIDFVSGAGSHAMGIGSSYSQTGEGNFAQGPFSSYNQTFTPPAGPKEN